MRRLHRTLDQSHLRTSNTSAKKANHVAVRQATTGSVRVLRIRPDLAVGVFGECSMLEPS